MSVGPDPRPFPPNPYSPTDRILRQGRTSTTRRSTRSEFTCSTRSICPNSGSSTAACASTISARSSRGPGTDVPGQPTSRPANTAKVQADCSAGTPASSTSRSRYRSFYAAYGTSESPIGSELDSTGPEYNGLELQPRQRANPRRRGRSRSAPSGNCSTGACSPPRPCSRPTSTTRARTPNAGTIATSQLRSRLRRRVPGARHRAGRRRQHHATTGAYSAASCSSTPKCSKSDAQPAGRRAAAWPTFR